MFARVADAVASVASRRRPGSARPSELLFDLTVGVRLWRELVGARGGGSRRRRPTLAAADNGEVCDHLSLVFLVAELSKDALRLLEELNRYGDATARMDESESEIVERQRLGLTVTKSTHDRERGTMLLGCLLVLAFTSKLRPELIESKRLTLRVDCDWFRPKSL